MKQPELQKLQIGDRVTVKFYPYRKIDNGSIAEVRWGWHWDKYIVFSVMVLIDGDASPTAVHKDIIQLADPNPQGFLTL